MQKVYKDSERFLLKKKNSRRINKTNIRVKQLINHFYHRNVKSLEQNIVLPKNSQAILGIRRKIGHHC